MLITLAVEDSLSESVARRLIGAYIPKVEVIEVFGLEETVTHNGETLLQRPDSDDTSNPELLTETALEQIKAKRHFRTVVEFFDEITYLRHISFRNWKKSPSRGIRPTASPT